MEKTIYTDEMFNYNMLYLKQYLYPFRKFDAVIAPSRGGLPIGVKVSHMFDIPLGIIKFQRLDNNSKKNDIQLALEPVGKDADGEELPSWEMKNILLVDDICDTGKSIEYIYKYLKLIYPNAKIEVFTLFASKDGIEYLEEKIPNFEKETNFLYLNDCVNWVVFPWENDGGKCSWCSEGEVCRDNPLTHTHCDTNNASYVNNYKCEKFKLKTLDVKSLG